MITISVILPVYKVGKYIRRCLESIIDQECNAFKLECIIIDDASPDDSMAIVDDIISNYQGASISFTIIRHEENKGLSMSRNSGIMASSGDYLFFIDSDDAILENTFKCFYEYYRKYPYVDVIMGNSFDVENGKLTNVPFMKYVNSPIMIEDKREIMQNALRRILNRNAWNKFIRRSLVIDNNLVFDKGLLYEDVTWTYKLYSCISTILIIPELTYIYEYNPMSIVHTPAQRSGKLIWSFVFISEFLLNNPPVDDGKKIFFTEHCLFVYYWMIKIIDLQIQFGIEPQICVKLNTLKRRLFWQSFCHIRPFMSLFFLSLFKPFSMMMKMGCFRKNIDRMIRIVYILS